MFTVSDYEKAIGILREASTQTEPDGKTCVVCGDSGHQAWECHHNPLVLVQRAKEAEIRWRCFHCNEVFDDYEQARKHFGNNSMATPKCVMKKCLCRECSCNPTECSGRG